MQGQEKEAMIILKINTTSNPFASVNTLVKKMGCATFTWIDESWFWDRVILFWHVSRR